MKYLLDKPEQIKISLTNICNYRCVMCYNPALKEERGLIRDDLLFRILDECKRLNIAKVSLGATGEPLVHKGFTGYLKYAKSLSLWVSTCTNASLLTPEISEALIAEGIDHVSLSIYSSNPDEHSEYTETDLFDQVVKNTEHFLTLWHKNKNKNKIRVEMKFLEIPGINNYGKFVEFWGPLAKKIGLGQFYIPIRKLQNWSGRNFRYDASYPKRLLCLVKDGEGAQIISRPKTKCPSVGFYLSVAHNGKAYPCCNIPESAGCQEIEFGDLNKDGIMDIWRSERFLSFQRDHYNRKAYKYGPCRICSSIQPTFGIRLSPRGIADLAKTIAIKIKNRLANA